MRSCSIHLRAISQYIYTCILNELNSLSKKTITPITDVQPTDDLALWSARQQRSCLSLSILVLICPMYFMPLYTYTGRVIQDRTMSYLVKIAPLARDVNNIFFRTFPFIIGSKSQRLIPVDLQFICTWVWHHILDRSRSCWNKKTSFFSINIKSLFIIPHRN